MVKEGYHRLRLSNGESVKGPVVVLRDENGKVMSWHVLKEEETGTVWRGGEIKI